MKDGSSVPWECLYKVTFMQLSSTEWPTFHFMCLRAFCIFSILLFISCNKMILCMFLGAWSNRGDDEQPGI